MQVVEIRVRREIKLIDDWIAELTRHLVQEQKSRRVSQIAKRYRAARRLLLWSSWVRCHASLVRGLALALGGSYADAWCPMEEAVAVKFCAMALAHNGQPPSGINVA
ncbi:MAG: hypothetical protein AUH13_15730 [Acidobacteria bacterium 13_2_20CM_58_27]|nr:MAG: hypothetical protein AUH13_15730 [Acidobacteria bacterium 13_2_20CM_58_27]